MNDANYFEREMFLADLACLDRDPTIGAATWRAFAVLWHWADRQPARICVTARHLGDAAGGKSPRAARKWLDQLVARRLIEVIETDSRGMLTIQIHRPHPDDSRTVADAQNQFKFAASNGPQGGVGRYDVVTSADVTTSQGPDVTTSQRPTPESLENQSQTHVETPASDVTTSQRPTRPSMESMDSLKGRNSNLPSSHRTTPSVHGIHGIHGSAAHRTEPPARNEEPSTGPALMAEGATRYGPDGHRRAEPSGSGIVGAFVELAKQSKPSAGNEPLATGAELAAEAAAAFSAAPKPEQMKQDLERRIIDAVADPEMNRAIAGKAADMVVFYKVPEHEIDRVLRDVAEMRRAGNLRKTPGAFALTKFRALAHNRLPAAMAEKLFPLPKKTPETDP